MGRRTRSSKSRKSQLRNRRPTTPVARKRPGHRLATQRPSRIPPRWPCRLRRRPCTRRTSAADVVDQRNAFAKAETAGELTAARASKALQAVATCVAGVEPGSGASGAPHNSRGKSQPRRRHRCRGHGGRGATAALSARQAKRCRRRSYIHDRISRSGRASLCVHIQLRPEFKMNPSESITACFVRESALVKACHRRLGSTRGKQECGQEQSEAAAAPATVGDVSFSTRPLDAQRLGRRNETIVASQETGRRRIRPKAVGGTAGGDMSTVSEHSSPRSDLRSSLERSDASEAGPNPSKALNEETSGRALPLRIVEPDGTPLDVFPLPTDPTSLESLLRDIFENHWRDVVFGPIMPGAAWEMRADAAPKISLFDGYLTVAFGVPHFHICIGDTKGRPTGRRRLRFRPIAAPRGPSSIARGGAPVSQCRGECACTIVWGISRSPSSCPIRSSIGRRTGSSRSPIGRALRCGTSCGRDGSG